MSEIDYYDPAVRMDVAKFRCSKAYPSFAESPFADFCVNGEHSDLIDGNCLVIRRQIPMFGVHYITYLADPTGFISSIKKSFEYAGSMQEALAWTESEDFWCNKEQYVAESDVPLHIFPTTDDDPETLKSLHLKFQRAYAEYRKAVLTHEILSCPNP